MFVLFLACSSPPPSAPPAEPHVAPAPAPVREVLAPSPLELRAEIREAGLGDRLAAQVPTTLPSEIAEGNPDQSALKTGVLFARTLLGPPPDAAGRLERLRAMRAGLAHIQTDPEHLELVDAAITQLENETVAWDDLLGELDSAVQDLWPNASDGALTGPMLQAGAWLAGIHAVASAVVDANDDAAADRLLRRSEVARWFLGYVRSDDGDAKLGPTAHAVSKALSDLDTVFGREHIGVEGAREVQRITSDLLELAL
ncbi:MAG: hypothetical protein R3F61_07060 [Myxococcota bacterium]